MELTVENVVNENGADIWEFAHLICEGSYEEGEPYQHFVTHQHLIMGENPQPKSHDQLDKTTAQKLAQVMALLTEGLLEFGPLAEKAFFNILELADYLGCQHGSMAQILLPQLQQLLARGKVTGFYHGVRNVALAMRVRQRLTAATFH